MPQLPLYPEDYDRDYWIESLLRITEDNSTDTQLEQHLELAREAVYPSIHDTEIVGSCRAWLDPSFLPVATHSCALPEPAVRVDTLWRCGAYPAVQSIFPHRIALHFMLLPTWLIPPF